jgi:hypothetical protein
MIQNLPPSISEEAFKKMQETKVTPKSKLLDNIKSKLKGGYNLENKRDCSFAYNTQEELVNYLLNNTQKDSLHTMIGLGLSNISYIKKLLKKESTDLEYTLKVIENILADYKEMNNILIKMDKNK